jgi:hypothetical protein
MLVIIAAVPAMLLRVVWLMVTEFAEERAALVVRVEE